MMNLRKYSKSWTNIKEKMKDENNSIGDTTLSKWKQPNCTL